MRVLGVGVHVQAYFELEFTQVLARAWAAFHKKAPLRRNMGSLRAKSPTGLRILRVDQLKMAVDRGRAAASDGDADQDDQPRQRASQGPDKGWTSFARRCSAWSQLQWRQGRVP